MRYICIELVTNNQQWGGRGKDVRKVRNCGGLRKIAVFDQQCGIFVSPMGLTEASTVRPPHMFDYRAVNTT